MNNDWKTSIGLICEQGNVLFDQNDFHGALVQYIKAIQAVPQPAEAWEETTWILSAIGDSYYQMQNYERAREAFTDAITCPGGLGNPFIHLRLREAQLELGNESRAKDELARAYMGGGPEIFDSEPVKYIEFLRRYMNIP
ncbi:hypothetical protein CCAX7_55510 [Capsulimonas corticalis]|uniref:Uncharacterized protein n=1 Tax=Capsulimonas corticalis TaxID=2219043 RepID=A0A402D0T8_9BACT|nr:hypothetical protein CCAX7_55510 [Capsulimonas corticalis]